MQAGLDAVGDHSCAIAEWRGRCRALDPDGKQKSHAIGATKVEILADECLEEVPSLHRAIEYVGETHLKLTDGEAMVVTGGAVRGRHRPGESLRPAIEEGFRTIRASWGGVRGEDESAEWAKGEGVLVLAFRSQDIAPGQSLEHGCAGQVGGW